VGEAARLPCSGAWVLRPAKAGKWPALACSLLIAYNIWVAVVGKGLPPSPCLGYCAGRPWNASEAVAGGGARGQ
jgi:hypothetical protein